MSKLLTNAFPAMPIQDKFGQMAFPSTGLSKLEYFALEMFKCHYANASTLLPETLIRISIEDAALFLTKLDEHTKKLLNENDKMAIVEP